MGVNGVMKAWVRKRMSGGAWLGGSMALWDEREGERRGQDMLGVLEFGGVVSGTSIRVWGGGNTRVLVMDTCSR